MKKKLFVGIFFLTILGISGCKKFLNVNPKSTISENELFKSEIGFQQALIGVYSQAADRSLYGENLSLGFLSVLAQNYSSFGYSFIFKDAAELNYKAKSVIDTISRIWYKSYNAIAGINNIMANIDKNKNIFTMNNYALTKGEALGLRAYLHFDLLRLFGATFTGGAELKSIPYRLEFNTLSKKPVSVEEIINQALADLKQAEDLLKDIDPIMFGDKNRRFKMNYLAVLALQARIYLYKNDKINAAVAAKKVIDSEKFTFITDAQISATTDNRDRLFSNEQVFSLRVKNIKDWAEAKYFKANGGGNTELRLTNENFDILHETASGGTTDYRRVYLIENDGSKLFPSKFWQTWKGSIETERLDQIVPLIRLSEMYYIFAECANTPEEGIAALNIIRKNRGLPEIPITGITAEKLNNEITKEYQKELYAEGQVFFYYKRKNMAKMQFSSKTLTAENYIIPIPENELEFNTNYN